VPLHLTKIAYKAQSLEEMHGWFAQRGAEARLTTRYLPRRHAELIGGSVFWILKCHLVTRSEILRFEEAEQGKTHIIISTRLIDVIPVPCHAHQGWRYLEAAKVPPDLASTRCQSGPIPGPLAGELARLGLL